MPPRTPTIAAAVVGVASALILSACGSHQAVRTADRPTAASSAPATSAPGDAVTPEAGTVPSAEGGGAGAASIVAGLTPAELRTVLDAPVPATRARSGPVAERVALAGGRSAWRVRIPGRFPVRSARAFVSVGGRRIGLGAVGPHLTSLVAVSPDGTGLVAGAVVSYRWEGSEPVVAGRLQVVR